METYCAIRKELYSTLHQKGKDRESLSEHGGIFIGYFRGPYIEIDDLTFPSPDDESMQYKFIRKQRYHQEKALKAWNISNHTKTYVGEWHTHPSGHATPSPIDINTWKKIVLKSNRQMVFVISTPIELKFFLGSIIRKKERKLVSFFPVDILLRD